MINREQELPLVLSVEEMAKILRIGRNTAYGLVQAGQVRSIRVGRVIRIPREALWEYLNSL